MFTPTHNQASGVKKSLHEAYSVSLSEAERHKSTTSTSSSSSTLPPSSARFAPSVPHIFVKTFWISAALVVVVAKEIAVGGVEADV